MRYNQVKNYEKLAKYYDCILADEQSLKDYWLKELLKSSCGKKTLELACGSGMFSRILKQNGFDVIASDLQEEMINVAESKDSTIKYFVLNMIDFDLKEKFDNIICICDSINYLDIDELKKMFESVYKHLNVGGLFLFDMHHVERLNEFEEMFLEEGCLKDIDYQWSIVADKQYSMLFENFVFYENDEIFIEKHKQYIHNVEDVENILIKLGFDVEVNSEFIESEKVLIKGVKK